MHEMIYTSAPKTLEAAGLGAVAMTSGIPRVVEAAMRRLSRFDFFSLPEDQRTPKAFKVLSHVIVKDGNIDWHICSRTLPAGLDYTNRPNFLSHHVAFTDDELPSGYSVFDVFTVNGLFVDDWNSEPQTIASRHLHLKGTSNQFATAWQSVEAGANGCQQLVEWYKSRKKAFLLDDSPIRIYQLFKAASHKFAGINANQIAFTTALGADTQGIAFDWIGIIRGSKFSNTVLSSAPEKVIDTQNKLFSVELTDPSLETTSTKVDDKRKMEQTGGGFDDNFFESYVTAAPRANSHRSSRTRVTDKQESDIPPPPPPQRTKSTARFAIRSVPLLLFAAALGFGAYATSQWKSTVATLEQRTTELAKKNDELKIASEQWDKEKEDVVNETTSLEAERVNLQTKLDELTKERDLLELQRNKFQADADRLQKEKDGAKPEAPSTTNRQPNVAAPDAKPLDEGASAKSSTPEKPAGPPVTSSNEASKLKEIVACIDTQQLQTQKSVRFSLGKSYAKLKSVSVIDPNREVISIPVDQASNAFQLRIPEQVAPNHVLEVALSASTIKTSDLQEPSANPSIMTLTLKEADKETSIKPLPVLSPLRLELIESAGGGQPTAMLYVLFRHNEAAIGYINANDVVRLRKEDSELKWNKFIANTTDAKDFTPEALNILSTEPMHFSPISFRMPQIWPQKEEHIERFRSDSSTVLNAPRESGVEISKLTIAKTLSLELHWVESKKGNTSLKCYLKGNGNPYRPNLESLLESRLVGRVERRSEDNKTAFPLIYFGDEADFSSTVFLKPFVVSEGSPISEGDKK